VRRALLPIALLILPLWAMLGLTGDRSELSASGAAGAGTSSGVVLADNGGRIVAANADGSGVRMLTHPIGDESDANPAASPDGLRIAFTRSALESDAIEVMRADGSGLRKVGEGDYPQWAPDGALLAYESVSGITVVRPDGSNRRVLASDTGRLGLTWSPDSGSIAYSSAQGISIVNVGTGRRRLLLKMDGAWRPAWSPDGSRIAFMAWIESATLGDHDRILVMNANGSAAHPIGPTPNAETPTWSPDGTRLAYGQFTYPKAGPVVVVDVSTGRVTTKIPPLAGGESAVPSWSPEGDRLAFLRSGDAGGFADNGGDVWVVSADGTHPVQATRVFPFGGSQSPPQWLPGVAAITPDPPIPTAALRSASSQPLGRRYLVAALDGAAAAIVADPDESNESAHGGELGVWRGRGAVSWVGAKCAQRVALTGRRVYWSCYGSDEEGSLSELWTASWPGGRPERLLHFKGKRGGPAVTVAGNRSLVVYTLQHSLWRLQGTSARRIRQEGTELRPLSVDGGRVLLENGHGRLEVVNASGRLLASLPAGKNDVWDCLSRNGVIALGHSRIRVYRLPGGSLRSSWPVGIPGLAWRAGFPHGSLLPYQTETAWGEALFHLLDVNTGRDAVLTVADGSSPITAGITSAGLFYTATPPYSGVNGRVGFVPLSQVRAAMR
jgi:Tol biopolymer transport system component